MPRILDAHIHAYPPELFADARAWGESNQEPWFTACVAPSDRPSIQGWADVDQLIRDMDQADVEQVVLLGWYWENQSTCEWQNQWFTKWRTAHPDRIQAFATVKPDAGQRGLDDVKRCLDAGFSGIGELLPQVQDFSLADENFARLVALATSAQVPINLHVTDPLLPPGPGTIATPLEDYLRMAQQFPQANFILAHWGGGLPFFELSPRVKKHLRNVYYDTAASPLLYDKAVFRRVIDIIGADRILYGSDYPLRLYPRQSTSPDFTRFIADINSVQLTPDELDAIMGGNLRRLLKIP